MVTKTELWKLDGRVDSRGNPVNRIDPTGLDDEDDDAVDNGPSLWGFFKYITGIEDPVEEAETRIQKKVAKEKHDAAVFGNPATADFSGVTSYGQQHASNMYSAGVKAVKTGEVGLQVASIGVPDPSDALYLGLAFGGLKVVGKADNVSVYRSLDAAGNVQYTGITNNLARRAAEHLRQKGIEIEPLLTGLSRNDARAVEQVLIEIHGLQKQGGTLLNRINSIAKSRPEYAQQLQKGHDLLKSIGYE